MKAKRLLIDLQTLPEDGRDFHGELPAEVFQLPPGDAVPAGPLGFRLRVQRFGSELLLTGDLSAPFEFTCVRTLHPFIRTITVDAAAMSLEIADGGTVDATEALREEILIHFPADPRCDEADDPQECSVDPRYLAVDKPGPDTLSTAPRSEGDDRWSVLDAFKNHIPER